MSRIVEATLYRDSVLLGPVEVVGSTKHGDTALLAFANDQTVQPGDKVKTKAFLLNAREFVILHAHTKPMKIAGTWYEVRSVQAAK